MGIDYCAKIVIGLPSEDVPEVLDDSEGDYAYYNVGLDRISPYFDSPSEDWVIGVCVACTRDYQFKELDANQLILDICEARKKFLEVTGKQGKLYLSPNGS